MTGREPRKVGGSSPSHSPTGPWPGGAQLGGRGIE